MKFLFQNNIITLQVRRGTVMLEIFLNHFICNITRTPNTLTFRPKMSAPITLIEYWKLFLKATRCSTLQPLYYITYFLRRSIFYMQMYMVFAYNATKNMDVFRITNLFYYISTSYLNVAFEYLISVFCNPNYVHRKPRYCVTLSPVFFHISNVQNCVATESLALKVHSFN